MDTPTSPHSASQTADQPPTPGELLLGQLSRLLRPLARLLISHGIGYTEAASVMKRVFMAAARDELRATGRKETDAAVSLLSGVHRKEVRADTAAQSTPTAITEAMRSPSAVEQIYTRWLTDTLYTDDGGLPRALPITGPAPSFDALVCSVTRDFSRRTVLDEMIRTGLALEDQERVVPCARAIVPVGDFALSSAYFAENVSDHIRASAANLNASARCETPPFLEQSVFASGLSNASLALLKQQSRALWATAFDRMVENARDQWEADRMKSDPQNPPTGRMRFGVYFYSEDTPTDALPPSPANNP